MMHKLTLEALSDLASENLEALTWRVPQDIFEPMRLLAQFDVHPMADALQASSTISPIDPKLLELPGMRLAESVSGLLSLPRESLSNLFPMKDSFAAAVKLIEQDRVHWEDPLKTVGAFAQLHENLLADSIRKLSFSAQSVLASLDWSTLGSRIGVAIDAQRGLERSAVRLSEQYANLYASLSKSEEQLASVPLEATLGPPINVLAHGHSLRIISSRDPSESLIVEVRAEIVEATFGFVEELLGAFNGDYLTILRGARKQAVERGNDWVRHSASSYRQLMKNVLHRAAPSDAVRPWATAKGDLDNKGFPKRRTKVRWLCRNVVPESYRSFLVEDIDSALKLIGVLDDAVHEDDFDICKHEFEWISLRVERALQELLKLWPKIR